MDQKSNDTPLLPGPEEILQTITSRYQEFSQTGALSGILLLIAAGIAVAWANSAGADFYFELWNAPFEIRLAGFTLEEPLLIWVNDGLMGIFFFYVGLEIKREIKVGELSQPGQAVLPIIAALGGILAPAAIFLFLSGGSGPESEGWGVPMATDIAFSLGLLMLLGKRVPDGIKIFLTAFAIVDDLAAVIVIAVFYSEGVHLAMLAWAGVFYGLMWLLNARNVRSGMAYFLLATVMWYFFLKSGVHPTIAGILAALAIPANTQLRMKHFVQRSRSSLYQFWDEKSNELRQFLTSAQLNAIDDMNENIEKVQPPLQRLENALHRQVSFFIMPVFALANAGVALQSPDGDTAVGNLTWYVFLSLLLGKAIGIFLFSWLGVKLKLAGLPSGANWINMIGVGLLGGVGFTMSLFIAGLAFTDPELLSQAKIGILFGSAVAGLAGVAVLRLSLKKEGAEVNNKSRRGE